MSNESNAEESGGGEANDSNVEMLGGGGGSNDSNADKPERGRGNEGNAGDMQVPPGARTPISWCAG